MKKLKSAFVVAALLVCSIACAAPNASKEGIESDEGGVSDLACSLFPAFCMVETTGGGGGGKEPPKV